MKFAYGPESRPIPGFTIKRAIDRGGFGEVYYALSDSGKEIALKLLNQNHQVELRGITQCLNLKHPNLLSIYDVKTDSEGDYWVVMEYISGRNLEQELDLHPNGMSVGEVQEWLTGMSAGVNYLHDRGIVHRDLKPANVFRENGVVKIGDVGLSKFITPSRRSAQTESVGTVYYMAPEVARGRYGAELDVYSMAIMLHEMLTGQVPFDGESTGEILLKHMTERPDLSRVHPALQPVLERALVKDPMQRTRSPRQLADEFTAAVSAAGLSSDASAAATGARVRPDGLNGPGLNGQGAGGFVPPPRATPGGSRPYDRTVTHPGTASSSSSPSSSSEPPGESSLADDIGRWWFRSANSPRNNPWTWVGVGLALLWVKPWAWFRLTTIEVMLLGAAIGGVAYCVRRYEARRRRSMRDSHASARPSVKPLRKPPPPLRPKYPTPPTSSSEAVEVVQFETADGRSPPLPPPLPPLRPVARDRRIKLENRKNGEKSDHTIHSPLTQRSIPTFTRISDTVDSMSWAVAWTAIVTLFLSFATNLFEGQGLAGRTDLAMMFALPTLFGSWVLLALGKFFEGRSPESTSNIRFPYAVAGAGFGCLVSLLHDYLMLTLDFRTTFDSSWVNSIGGLPLVDSAVQPTMVGYALFFGLLFGLRRWWWHADSFRPKRIRVWSVVGTLLLAFVIPAAITFPQNWGVAWAVAMSLVVQAAGSFVRPEDRAAYLEQLAAKPVVETPAGTPAATPVEAAAAEPSQATPPTAAPAPVPEAGPVA